MIGLYRREWNLSVPEFDLVIVGGGSAGLELARMATRAELNVALIEQGVSSGRHIFQRIPLMVGKIIGNSRFVNVWRSIPLTSAGGFARPILAGRGLGGSSRINGNVAYAGPRYRYAQVYDKIGLNFSDILRELSPGASKAAPRVHTWTDGLSELFLKATVADGARLLDDPDDDFFGASPLHVNTRWGLRHNHLEAFYRQAKKSKLTIVQGTAKELIFTDSRVSGVVLVDGVEIHAQEIIVSAGAIGSPTLLLQSGIGDSAMLRRAGIAGKLDQPHVGRHLKDHANLRIPFSCPEHDTLNQKTRGFKALAEGFKFLTGQSDTILRGPGASAGLNVEWENPYRIQLVHFTQDRSQVGTKGIVFEKVRGASLGMYALWPYSEGSVELTSKELRIDPGFLADQRDMKTTLQALSHARNLIFQMGFAPHSNHIDDETLIRTGVYSGYHLIGSNRMATTARDGVIAPDFRVHGIDGLSICDASVMPDHLSSHSYLATIAQARMLGHQRGWI